MLLQTRMRLVIMSSKADHGALDRVAQKIKIQSQISGKNITHDEAKRFLVKQLQKADNKKRG